MAPRGQSHTWALPQPGQRALCPLDSPGDALWMIPGKEGLAVTITIITSFLYPPPSSPPSFSRIADTC